MIRQNHVCGFVIFYIYYTHILYFFNTFQNLSYNFSSAKYNIINVKHHRLSRCNSPLRLFKFNLYHSIFFWINYSIRFFCPISYLGLTSIFFEKSRSSKKLSSFAYNTVEYNSSSVPTTTSFFSLSSLRTYNGSL